MQQDQLIYLYDEGGGSGSKYVMCRYRTWMPLNPPSQMFFFTQTKQIDMGPNTTNGTFLPSALQSCNSIHVFGSRPRMGSGVRYKMVAERFDLSKNQTKDWDFLRFLLP